MKLPVRTLVTLLVYSLVTILLFHSTGLAAEVPPYTLASADDWSEGEVFRVRFVVEAEAVPTADAAEAIARDLVERRVKRRVLHVADVRIYPAGSDLSGAPAALVLWASGNDLRRRPAAAPGDYSSYRYAVSIGAAAAAARARLDALGAGDAAAGGAPAPPGASATSGALATPAAAARDPRGGASSSATPVHIDLGPGERVAGGRSGASGSRSPSPAPDPPAATPPTDRGAGAGAAEASLRAEVLAFLARWRAAWEARDLDAYLGHYAPSFRSGALDRDAFRAQKGRVFAAAGTIHLDFREVEVTGAGAGARVRFIQEYRSNVKQDEGVKTLELVAEGGQWKIASEDWTAR